MINKPIGVFDSGLGGLSAVKELINILPNEDIIYFGDTGRVPYGNKSEETIRKYAFQDTAFLMSLGVKMIIAACGTVSSVASDIKESLPVPFTGVVHPTSLVAANTTKNGKIGVIGTSATIKSSSYKKQISLINPSATIYEQDCPLFVPLVENGFVSENDPIVKLAVKRYLTSLKDAGIDTLILGCTHYPIIKKSISEFMGENVALIDSGKETAIYAANLLKQNNLLKEDKSLGKRSFYVSDSIDGFCNIADLFLGYNINHNVKQVNIDMY